MNRTPACEPGITGSVRMAPYMSAWPRGSSISARRRGSACRLTHSRLSSIVLPCGEGKPSTIKRSGSPAACASMVRRRWIINGKLIIARSRAQADLDVSRRRPRRVARGGGGAGSIRRAAAVDRAVRVKAFYSDTFVLPLPEHHRFPMTKYRLVRERLLDEGVLTPADLRVPDAIDWNDVRLVHDAAYVDAVANGTIAPEMQRRIGFPWSPMMVERSRRSVGATLAAAREALGCSAGLSGARAGGPEGAALRSTAVAANLAGGTHHAFRDRGEGFCVFNDVAVAAAVLLRDGGITRAAVVDCDVHQGNGTAAIFRDQPAVFTFSLHGARNFPFRKETSDLDVTFDDGAGDDEYLAALDEHLPPRLETP